MEFWLLLQVKLQDAQGIGIQVVDVHAISDHVFRDKIICDQDADHFNAIATGLIEGEENPAYVPEGGIGNLPE